MERELRIKLDGKTRGDAFRVINSVLSCGDVGDKREAYEELVKSYMNYESSYSNIIKEIVSVYIKDGKLIKNRNGSIDEELLVALATNTGDVALEVEGEVTIYTCNKNKYSKVFIELITKFGIGIMDKVTLVYKGN